MRKTIQEHCEDRALLIPQALFEMSDACPLLAEGSSAIFHKKVQSDMRDIEFYSSVPCLVYVIRGTETFFSSDHEVFEVKAGEMLLIPQNTYMISDFVHQTGSLEALLFFFNQEKISEFLKHTARTKQGTVSATPCKVKATQNVAGYMEALKTVYGGRQLSSALLSPKLLELLHLLDAEDDLGRLKQFLVAISKAMPKRNIKHVMREHCFRPLTVKDYAALTGRSVASFTRDFKRLYHTTPRQWLIDTRIAKALGLVKNTTEPITNIAFSVGYENISHFIKLFRERYGKTPKQFRASLL